MILALLLIVFSLSVLRVTMPDSHKSRNTSLGTGFLEDTFRFVVTSSTYLDGFAVETVLCVGHVDCFKQIVQS